MTMYVRIYAALLITVIKLNDNLIYYNTVVRGLTDIYARLSRARSTRGRVHIYQSNPEQSCVITFMLHFA